MVSAKSLILTGPTASGKTALAIDLIRNSQRKNQIEIINADSLLVYREMNIGTAKPSFVDLSVVPHHLIDIRDPDETFTAGDFVRLAEAAIKDIHARGKRAILVGGTGFYLKALLKGLWDASPTDTSIRSRLETDPTHALYQRLNAIDPTASLRIGLHDRYRLIRALEIYELSGKTPSQLDAEHNLKNSSRSLSAPLELMIIDRSIGMETRIRTRTQVMLRSGLLEEVQILRAKYPNARALSAVGYVQCASYLDGKAPSGRKIREGLLGLEDEIVLATLQLVKKQRTFFRGQFKTEGHWFDLETELEKFTQAFQNWINDKNHR